MNTQETKPTRGCRSETGFGVRVTIGLAIILSSAILSAAIGGGIGAVITKDVGSPACGFLSAGGFAAGLGLGTRIMMVKVFRERH